MNIDSNKLAYLKTITNRAIEALSDTAYGVSNETIQSLSQLCSDYDFIQKLVCDDFESILDETAYKIFAADSLYHLRFAYLNLLDFYYDDIDFTDNDELLDELSYKFANALYSICTVQELAQIQTGTKGLLKNISAELNKYCYDSNNTYLLSFVSATPTKEGALYLHKYGGYIASKPTTEQINRDKSNKAFECLLIAAEKMLIKSHILCSHISGCSKMTNDCVAALSIKSTDTLLLIINNVFGEFYYGNGIDEKYRKLTFVTPEGTPFNKIDFPNEIFSDVILKCIYQYKNLHKNIDIVVQYDSNILKYYEKPEEYLEDILDDLLRGMKDGIGTKNISISFYHDYFGELINSVKTVQSFSDNVIECINSHKLTTSNVGSFIDANKDELLEAFALASNNYIGSHYNNALIDSFSKINKSSHIYRRYTFIDYINVGYSQLFADINEKANRNISLLKSGELLNTFFTSEWLFSNIGEVSGFDNTFICSGYLKLVELLLATILVRDYSGKELTINKTESIRISSETMNKLMIENMVRFITLHSIVSPKHWTLVHGAIDKWRENIRNGYFHKDMVDASEVLNIRNKTFEIIYMILGTVPKD